MNPPCHLRSFYRFDLGRLFIFCVSISFKKQSKLAFIFVPTAPLTASHPVSPPRQVELAEAVLRAEGGALAGLSAVSRLQLFPGDLCYPGGAAADSGAAHRHQAAAVWVLEAVWHHLNKYGALLAFGWGEGICSICGPGLLRLFSESN